MENLGNMPKNFRFTRQHAKMVAEELYKLTKPDVSKAMSEVIEDETEEFICTKDAARLIGISVGRLYQTKDTYGCYTRINGRIRFAKRRLIRAIQTGCFQQ